MASASSGPHGHVVRVWHAHTDVLRRDPHADDRARTWLTPAERLRHARYRRDADRDMFLLGRVMARAIVGDALGVAPVSWPWREGLRGRPEVDLDLCPVTFNIAHSGGLVACALSWHGEVGVDIEDRQRESLEYDLIARCCSPTESADVHARGADGWRDRFLQYWTLKEAYLKARGLGISVHLADISFSLQGDDVQVEFRNSMATQEASAWAFDLITLHAEHFLAVASPFHGSRRPAFRFDPFPLAWLP